MSGETQKTKERYIPALDTIKTMLKVTRILSLVLAIVLVLWGFISGIIALLAAIYTPAVLTILIGPIVYFIFGVIDYVIYTEIREINALVDSKKYAEAKEKTLVWAVIGLILGGVLPGIFLLIAYIKYDEVIRTTASSSSPQPQTSAI